MVAMTPERWRQITEIFHGAIAIRDAPAREAYLHDACSDDPLLREEIDSLLAAPVDRTSSIDAPLPRRPASPIACARVDARAVPRRGVDRRRWHGRGLPAHDSRLGRTVALKRSRFTFARTRSSLRGSNGKRARSPLSTIPASARFMTWVATVASTSSSWNSSRERHSAAGCAAAAAGG